MKNRLKVNILMFFERAISENVFFKEAILKMYLREQFRKCIFKGAILKMYFS